jgi:hypothetical protein
MVDKTLHGKIKIEKHGGKYSSVTSEKSVH